MLWASSNRRRKLYAELVREHLDSLHRTAVRLIGSGTDAEDLVQETFLRAWRSFDQLREVAGARAWLFCLLRSAYIDNMRKAARRPRLVHLEKATAREPATEAANEPILPLELRKYTERRELEKHFDEQVLQAVDELPDEERLALLFQVFGGLSGRPVLRPL